MSCIALIWGFNYIVLKNGVSTVDPLTFNALRFGVALPLLTVIALRDRDVLRLSLRDFGLILGATILGPITYQILFISGLARTTSTNTSLLVATSPAWTAVISIMIGMVMVQRRLLVGLAITLGGVVLVILGRAGADLSLSRGDMIGSVLSLSAAVMLATGNILKKPLVDRLGGMKVTLWSYWMLVAGLAVAASPHLVHLSAADVPVSTWPNILYGGLVAGVGGFMAVNYALKALGPTRTATYYNYPPIIAGIGGVLLLGDPLTVGLVVGAVLTLWGVVLVRRNVYLRKPRSNAA